MVKVKKRNGKIVDYDDSKVFRAIQLANKNSKDKRMTIAQITKVVQEVEDVFKDIRVPNVEKISDVTENILMKSQYVNTAKSYIIHRSEHKKRRDDIENIMNNFIDLTFKGDASVDSHRDNANIEAKATMGAMLKYGTDISKYFIDNYVMPEEYVQAMNEGWLHFHKSLQYAC
jgi:ribonucleoside-triphosphate reductase